MRTLSFRDVRLIPELSKYNEIELLNPQMDSLVNSFLGRLGFDMEFEIEYVPSLHRDMQNKIAVGFQFVGEISLNRNFINSSMCSMTERLAAAAYQDPSLTRELSSMLGGNQNYYSLSEVDAEDAGLGYAEDEVEEDYEWVSLQIRQLETIRDQIRNGSQG